MNYDSDVNLINRGREVFHNGKRYVVLISDKTSKENHNISIKANVMARKNAVDKTRIDHGLTESQNGSQIFHVL